MSFKAKFVKLKQNKSKKSIAFLFADAIIMLTITMRLGGKGMNAQDRKDYILDILKKNHSVKILKLSKELRVTRETIRKDLYELEKEGLIKKIHGGAVLDSSNQETDYERRKSEYQEAKTAIAKQAAKHIEEGDTIYLDYGTTTLALAKEIMNFKNITVITNTIPIINLLLHSEDINLLIPGGMLRKNEDSLYGPFASNNLQNIFVDIGFFGCGGIDDEVGITNHHMGETMISKEMIHHSQTSIILADHSKFGSIAFNRTATFDEIDIIITDEDLSLETYEKISQKGVEIYCTDDE
ncbi:hypothetical protein A5881_001647 [Enterococcus termitis]|nr:hypothetical protein A5881_002028 [Enterococcus termitis]